MSQKLKFHCLSTFCLHGLQCLFPQNHAPLGESLKSLNWCSLWTKTIYVGEKVDELALLSNTTQLWSHSFMLISG